MLFAAALCAVFGPVYYFITQGIKSTTIEVKIPFIPDEEDVQYSVNMLLQFGVLFHGIFIYMGIETVMTLFENVVNVTPYLIKSRLNKLNKMHEVKELSELQVRFTFLDVTKQMLGYER